ncbi:hypothetical protein TEU_11310 [Thermococcus eurythermalis]|uniref:Uncharacterized protein n=1 Tax=Thermococcus eurythermalis TaxID=1505907 RepID=A0A097QWL5_9EURY|nr:hypothetical protein [Thermococcus eurythermalis]AIU70872.1 hypothetical protein TEU_11310 [Thermococcus eurythermalis]
MRLVTKNEAVKRALIEELRKEGVRFEVRSREGYEAFVGYAIEGTLKEIEEKIESLEGADVEAIKEGFLSFRESLNHVLEHLKAGEKADELLKEGLWAAELLDQLYRNGAIEYDGTNVKLKEGTNIEELRFEFKFPFNLVHDPGKVEEKAKQFAFVDLVTEHEFEILELNIAKVNALGKVASKYFPEDYLLKVYFALVGRAIVAEEILKALGDRKVPEEELIKGFLRAAPIVVPTPKGTLVINYSRSSFEETLKLLKRLGYVEIKGGKVRKLKELA